MQQRSGASSIVQFSQRSSRLVWSHGDCFQLGCQQSPSGRVPHTGDVQFLARRVRLSRHRSSRQGTQPCIFQLLWHFQLFVAASTSPRVSIARRPFVLVTLGAIARYCARKAIGERRCIGVTSKSPAFLGKRILLTEACSTKHGQQSVNNLVEFLWVRSQRFRRDNATIKGQAIV